MTASQKITLNQPQGIPFNKLILSQANVRRVKTGISVEELAEDIARRGLLQSLSVRPVMKDGAETGMFEVPAGGRRFRALQLLVKQKRMAKTQLVPCIARTEGLAEEDSLAENVQRVALHPLDQFRAFLTLRNEGLSEEEIAARFFVNPTIVKQRLKLAAVSPKLLDIYAEDEMTLEQLMAFTVTNDHERQEQVWASLANSYDDEPYTIRRQLTEGAVRGSDRRAQFVGVDTYEAAGGPILRDLFEEDNGGFLQDPALLDRLVAEKLTREAEALRGEGWKWIEGAVQFPYGHTSGLRELPGEEPPLSDDEQASYDALSAEYAELEQKYAEAEELPEEVDARLAEIETALRAFDERPAIYEPADVARAGVFISIDSDGDLCIERGFVRAEDEAPAADQVNGGSGDVAQGDAARTVINVAGHSSPEAAEEEDGIKPLPDRLVTELTAHRTLALRNALANDPDTAFLAVLHALCLQAFYQFTPPTCLEVTAKSASLGIQAPGLSETVSAKAMDARHDRWAGLLPEDQADLWDTLFGFDADSRAALFAHCASVSVNAVHEPWNRNPGRFAHATQLAQTLRLDMVEAGWAPTVENYLGRVTKARILEAVREAKGEASSQLIDHLKKPEMAKEAERLLAGTGWLPEPLRNTVHAAADTCAEAAAPSEALPAFLTAPDPGDAAEMIAAE